MKEMLNRERGANTSTLLVNLKKSLAELAATLSRKWATYPSSVDIIRA